MTTFSSSNTGRLQKVKGSEVQGKSAGSKRMDEGKSVGKTVLNRESNLPIAKNPNMIEKRIPLTESKSVNITSEFLVTPVKPRLLPKPLIPNNTPNKVPNKVLKSAMKSTKNVSKSVNFNLDANQHFELVNVLDRPTPSHRASIFSKAERKERKLVEVENLPSPRTPEHRNLIANRVALSVGKLLLETKGTPVKSLFE